jgi:hypothetical protein
MLSHPKLNNLKFVFSDIDGESKLQEAILYISDKCMDDPTFCATKLNKILFFSDYILYLEKGRPITGISYQKLPQGPAPKRLLPIREKMIKDGILVLKKSDYFNRKQDRTIALKKANLSKFSADEISLIDFIVSEFWGKNAAEISEKSHGIYWEVGIENDLIPYQAALLDNPTITENDFERSMELIQQFKWAV